MKRLIVICLTVCLLIACFAGCQSAEMAYTEQTIPQTVPQTQPPVTEPPVTEPPATEPPVTTPPVTEPPVTEPPVTEPPVTEPPVTEPPVTEPPATEPPDDTYDNELIGSLYTRKQLAAINGTRKGYGPGTSKNGNRPAQAVALQHSLGSKYNTWFIGPDDNKVYFTFCHGYERNNLTAQVLDVLKEKEVKAVFFINRDYARSVPHLVQRMIDEGHIIGSHATNHRDMGALSVDQNLEEIMVMHNYMLEHFGYEMKLFRPPSGYYSDRLLALAQSLGYTTVQWSYTYVDWNVNAPPNAEKFLGDVLNSAHSGAIYYFHTVTESGVSILDDAIDGLREKGYEFDLFTGQFE